MHSLIYKSTNSGTSWAIAGTGIPTGISIDAICVNGSTILVGNANIGTNNYGIYKSTNSGSSWSQAINGLTNVQVNSIFYLSNKYFVGTDGGVYLSTNSGANWGVKNSGLSYLSSVRDLFFDNDSVFACTDHGGVFELKSDGMNWQELNTGLKRSDVRSINKLGSELFISTDGGSSTTGGIFTSSNNGLSWSQINTGLPFNINGGLILNDGTNIIAKINSVYYITSDNGNNWSLLNNIPAGTSLSCAYGTNIYAIDNTDVYFSNDGCSSWSTLNCPAVGITRIAVRADIIFVGTSSNGIYRSLNHGQTWQVCNNGFGSTSSVNGISIDSGYVFISKTNSGIYYSTLTGNGWNQLNTGLPNLNPVGVFANKNILYTRYNSAGVWKLSIGSLPCVSSTYYNPQIICSDSSYSINGNSYSIAGSYQDTLISQNNCDSIIQTDLIVNNLPVSLITPGGVTTFCQGDSLTLTASSANSYLWSNSATTQNIIISTSGNYSVMVTNGNGCSATSSAMPVIVNPLPTTPTITANGTILTSSSATGNQWYLNGNIINGATTQTFTVTQNGIYTVVVTNTYGCFATSNGINFSTTEITNGVFENQIQITPNPNSGKFLINTGDLRLTQIKIYNAIGEIIYQSQTKNSEIDLSSKPKGTYFIEVQTQEKTYNKKVIIQ